MIDINDVMEAMKKDIKRKVDDLNNSVCNMDNDEICHHEAFLEGMVRMLNMIRAKSGIKDFYYAADYDCNKRKFLFGVFSNKDHLFHEIVEK